MDPLQLVKIELTEAHAEHAKGAVITVSTYIADKLCDRAKIAKRVEKAPPADETEVDPAAGSTSKRARG